MRRFDRFGGFVDNWLKRHSVRVEDLIEKNPGLGNSTFKIVPQKTDWIGVANSGDPALNFSVRLGKSSMSRWQNVVPKTRINVYSLIRSMGSWNTQVVRHSLGVSQSFKICSLEWNIFKNGVDDLESPEGSWSLTKILEVEYLENGVRERVCINRRLIYSCVALRMACTKKLKFLTFGDTIGSRSLTKILEVEYLRNSVDNGFMITED